ncbi:MAG: 5-methyltetrahydropteroyltriglutamate--homocysteine S-methyltransferase [Alphaproteobacteria bacterium]|nr:5-methyltetrahydropteroyltriglutamate--homocysteine S-methyltransferase [Alphaproteobacteria bacterium]
MSGGDRPPFRADHVGSLLRPKELLTARADFAAGRIDRAALSAVEDRCIRAAVKRQEDLGLRSITDGEYRRTQWHTDFLEKIEGVAVTGGLSIKFHRESGDIDFSPPVFKVVGKLGRKAGIETERFRFLKSVTGRTAKQCIPSPTMLHFRGGRKGIDAAAYPDLDDFYADLARLYADEIAALGRLGCTYLQIDETNLAFLCDTRMRAAARERGEDVDQLPFLYARILNEAIRARPAGMTVCTHICRGNYRSTWAAEGGYEPVAEALFGTLAVDGYFLEFDSARAGDFAPLRLVPKGKRVVLGLVTTKTPVLETRDYLLRRIEEAARFVPLDQLAISPQCGFASTVEGNELTEADEIAKLRLVVDIAREVWGTT